MGGKNYLVFLKKNFHIFFTAGNKEELNYVNQIKSESNCTILFNEDLLQGNRKT